MGDDFLDFLVLLFNQAVHLMILAFLIGFLAY